MTDVRKLIFPGLQIVEESPICEIAPPLFLQTLATFVPLLVVKLPGKP